MAQSTTEICTAETDVLENTFPVKSSTRFLVKILGNYQQISLVIVKFQFYYKIASYISIYQSI